MSDTCSLKVTRDEHPDNPRTEFDNLGTMLCRHRRYDLGDIPQATDAEIEEAHEEAFALLPVFMYDHSGYTIRTTPFSDPWDSGQLGIIYTTRRRLLDAGFREEDITVERAEELLRAEVEEYDRYLRGDVWGFMIEDEEGCIVSSGWGYTKEDAIEEGIAEWRQWASE